MNFFSCSRASFWIKTRTEKRWTNGSLKPEVMIHSSLKMKAYVSWSISLNPSVLWNFLNFCNVTFWHVLFIRTKKKNTVFKNHKRAVYFATHLYIHIFQKYWLLKHYSAGKLWFPLSAGTKWVISFTTHWKHRPGKSTGAHRVLS